MRRKWAATEAATHGWRGLSARGRRLVVPYALQADGRGRELKRYACAPTERLASSAPRRTQAVDGIGFKIAGSTEIKDDGGTKLKMLDAWQKEITSQALKRAMGLDSETTRMPNRR